MAKAVAVSRNRKATKPYIQAVGRRREAVARVRLYTNTKAEVAGVEVQKGDIFVNDKPIAEYFRFKPLAPVYNKFLVDMGVAGKYSFTAKVAGGGQNGQLEAMILGMARALDKFNTDEYHTVLREKGYLTRDPRVRERRKVGNAGKARRKKSSPKR